MALTRGFPVHNAIPTALDLRLNLAGLIACTATGIPRAGILPDHTDALVTGTSGAMAVSVAPFTAALSRGKAQGVSLIANDGIVNVPLDAAPSANARIDVIYVRQNDDVDGADANALGMFGVAKGAPGTFPAAPAVPSGAIALSQVRVPAGVVDTNPANGVTFTAVHPFTATTGGVIPFRTFTELAAWDATEGTLASQLNDDILWVRWNSSWQRVVPASPAAGTLGYSAGITKSTAVEYLQRDAFGNVSGIWSGTNTAALLDNTVIGTVPVGFRPAATVELAASMAPGGGPGTAGTCLVTIAADGTMRVFGISGSSNRKVTVPLQYRAA
jgi:hypothetical protein